MLTDFAPGTTLRTARIRLGLTLEQSAACLSLNVREVRLLEDEHYDAFPSRLYARTYLCRYAEFLGLDPEPMLESLRRAPIADLHPDEHTDPYGLPAALRHELRTDQPFLRQPRALRRTRRSRHLAPPPVTYVAYPRPGWIRPVRRGRPGQPRSRLWPPLAVTMLTAALTFVLYVVVSPPGDAAVRVGAGALGADQPVADVPTVATVRVLDGTHDEAMRDRAVRALRSRGYEVLSSRPLAEQYFSSAVLAPRGTEEEAAALVAADPRFGIVRTARDLDPEADLTVLVGRNWGR